MSSYNHPTLPELARAYQVPYRFPWVIFENTFWTLFLLAEVFVWVDILTF